MTYETLDHIVALVQQFGKKSLIAKVDIEDAFRIMPIHPKDYHLLVFTFQENFHYVNVSQWAVALRAKLLKKLVKPCNGCCKIILRFQVFLIF